MNYYYYKIKDVKKLGSDIDAYSLLRHPSFIIASIMNPTNVASFRGLRVLGIDVPGTEIEFIGSNKEDLPMAIINLSNKKTGRKLKYLTSNCDIDMMGSSRYRTTILTPDGDGIDSTNFLLDKTLEQGDGEWSNVRRNTITFDGSYMKEQIRSRYAFFTRPTNGLSNVILDSFFPRLLYKHNMNVNAIIAEERKLLPKTAVAISPIVAKVLNVKQVEPEQLCRVLGYDVKEIKRILNKVKAKDYTFVFVGAGGTGMNTAYWLTKLCEMTSTVNLFRNVHVYEKEDAELSNILRFPVDPTVIPAPISCKKSALIAPFVERLSRGNVGFHNKYIPEGSKGSYGRFGTEGLVRYERSEFTGGKRYLDPVVVDPVRTVFYGAPSLQAREELSNLGNFISGTHASTSCYLCLNPKQYTDISTESYGMIQLGGFFMNQLKMTIELMKYLGQPSVDLTSKDVDIMEFEFEGVRELSTDRQYNWQIEKNMTMLTETEATNF